MSSRDPFRRLHIEHIRWARFLLPVGQGAERREADEGFRFIRTYENRNPSPGRFAATLSLWERVGPFHPNRMFFLLGLLALGGCESVRPLYGSGSFLANGAQAEKMQSVAVDEISGRLGHYLGDDLKINLNGTGAPTDPQYHLVVTLTEGTETPLIDTVEGLATSATIVTTANFRLVPTANRKVYVGKAYVAASYDRNINRFSNVRAARDAEIRDARRLADEITTQVAAELATNP